MSAGKNKYDKMGDKGDIVVQTSTEDFHKRQSTV
jgi:hypothetical protein